MKRSEMRRAADRALEFYEKAGIALTEAEKASLEDVFLELAEQPEEPESEEEEA